MFNLPQNLQLGQTGQFAPQLGQNFMLKPQQVGPAFGNRFQGGLFNLGAQQQMGQERGLQLSPLDKMDKFKRWSMIADQLKNRYQFDSGMRAPQITQNAIAQQPQQLPIQGQGNGYSV